MRRIFYSWQSDRPESRNFIRTILEDVSKSIGKDLSIDDANREIVVDQDTQGIPGSPPIADSILNKIRASDIFIADLTYINADISADGRRTPNPNVMLEYGYALHALGDTRIVGLFNEEHGRPEELPFDLAHRRWPFRFRIHAGASPEERTAERKRLGGILTSAIKSILTQSDQNAFVENSEFNAAEAADGIGRLRDDNDYLCIGVSGNAKPISIKTGPYMFIRLMPMQDVPELSDLDAYQITQRNLQPMGATHGANWQTGRHQSGAVSYWTVVNKPEVAWDAAQLFLTRELWANDFYLLKSMETDRAKEFGFPFIPTLALEETFIDSFINFISVAQKQLSLPLPVRVIAGLVGVVDFRLAVNPDHFAWDKFAGRILRNAVVSEILINDWSVDPFDTLLPFFDSVYSCAGIQRPPTRTVGNRQR